MTEEQAARKLAAAKARLVLAEASNNLTEFKDALVAVEQAEQAYVAAVNE